MRISDWSSDVCSSDLPEMSGGDGEATVIEQWGRVRGRLRTEVGEAAYRSWLKPLTLAGSRNGRLRLAVPTRFMRDWVASNYARSEEHTSELQSLMRIPNAVFCLKKNKYTNTIY